MTIRIDGVEYAIVHAFTADRVLISYQGLFVLADGALDGWALSGKPATPAENAIIARFAGPLESSPVIVTAPDEMTKPETPEAKKSQH